MKKKNRQIELDLHCLQFKQTFYLILMNPILSEKNTAMYSELLSQST